MAGLENVRCQCGKIVCQIHANKVIIKCRHCKQYLVIETKGIKEIEYRSFADVKDLAKAE